MRHHIRHFTLMVSFSFLGNDVKKIPFFPFYTAGHWNLERLNHLSWFLQVEICRPEVGARSVIPIPGSIGQVTQAKKDPCVQIDSSSGFPWPVLLLPIGQHHSEKFLKEVTLMEWSLYNIHFISLISLSSSIKWGSSYPPFKVFQILDENYIKQRFLNVISPKNVLG